MAEDQKLLTEIEAQEVAEQFLLSKYFDSKVSFNDNQLITGDRPTRYRFHGKLTNRSRSSLGRLVCDKNANKYAFMIEVDAQQGCVIRYEIT